MPTAAAVIQEAVQLVVPQYDVVARRGALQGRAKTYVYKLFAPSSVRRVAEAALTEALLLEAAEAAKSRRAALTAAEETGASAGDRAELTASLRLADERLHCPLAIELAALGGWGIITFDLEVAGNWTVWAKGEGAAQVKAMRSDDERGCALILREANMPRDVTSTHTIYSGFQRYLEEKGLGIARLDFIEADKTAEDVTRYNLAMDAYDNAPAEMRGRLPRPICIKNLTVVLLDRSQMQQLREATKGMKGVVAPAAAQMEGRTWVLRQMSRLAQNKIPGHRAAALLEAAAGAEKAAAELAAGAKRAREMQLIQDAQKRARF